ncbi:MAG TPA: TylF/MycF/NovP-related O-methyltransferase [Methylocella sp.]|nr:TylF/MycF/NovP-related O-methyltransferase [Methylocella sp.]
MRRDLKYALNLLLSVPIFYKYKDRTLLSGRPYIDNLSLIGTVVDKEILKNGAIVECGTWRGGMAAGMIEFCGKDKFYCFFDSFEGLPQPKEIDGKKALEYAVDKDSPLYHNNARASIEIFNDTIARTGIKQDNVTIVKGFYEKSFQTFDSPQISVLRLDSDWYESTMLCLEKFWDFVIAGGIILIDDYYTFDGCSRAVHDFLSKNKSADNIRMGPIGQVAYIQKK